MARTLEELDIIASMIERNQFVGAPLRGSFPQIPSAAALPTAGEQYSYRIMCVRGTPDETYVCLRNSGGTWAWTQLSVVDTLSAIDFLVGTASGDLSAEIVVGTSPGGELGGTWASPTVDTTHSGSSHAGVVSTHEAASDPHTGYRLESADHSHQSTGAQAGQLDHGAALTGLSDNDHPQYALLTGATFTGDVKVTSTSGGYVLGFGATQNPFGGNMLGLKAGVAVGNFATPIEISHSDGFAAAKPGYAVQLDNSSPPIARIYGYDGTTVVYCFSFSENSSAARIGFYGTAPIALQTGIGVDLAAVRTALINLGLFTG